MYVFILCLNIALYIKIFKTINLYAYLFTTHNYGVTIAFSMDYVHFMHKNSVLFAIFSIFFCINVHFQLLLV